MIYANKTEHNPHLRKSANHLEHFYNYLEVKNYNYKHDFYWLQSKTKQSFSWFHFPLMKNLILLNILFQLKEKSDNNPKC